MSDDEAAASMAWFIAAIRRGYEAERAAGNEHIQAAYIWDRVVAECMKYSRGFDLMFAWDKRKGKQNRIGTISDFIRDGKVPGLTRVPGRRGIPEVVQDD
jgi:hypothetical protein